MPISELSALLNGNQHHLLASSAGITGAGHHRNQASRRSRYSAQARASELAGAKQAEAYPQNTCAQTKAAAPCTHPARPHNHPGIMQKPGIPAQQMQRTGTRERVCGSRTGQNQIYTNHGSHLESQESKGLRFQEKRCEKTLFHVQLPMDADEPAHSSLVRQASDAASNNDKCGSRNFSTST